MQRSESEVCVPSPKDLHLRKAALLSIFALLASLCCCSPTALCQDSGGFRGTSSFGLAASYSPDSSHILIGTAGQRRTWTFGAEYARLLHQTPQLRFDYEASLTPFFLESDPTVTATVFTSSGQTIVTQQTPERVVRVDHGPVGSILTGNGSMAPIYAIFGRQNTYAASIAPLGVRVSALPRWIVQPSFAVNLGFVVSARDIPIDDSDQFNYTFALGPGVQFFTGQRTSWRLEYLYRHISNAGQGAQNPGIDQGVVRLTVSRHR